MPIDKPHDEYTVALPKWERCRDAVAGQSAVHQKGVTYLPMLTEQSQEEYNAYKLRATYANFTGRTLEGLVGMVFRKAPTIEAPDSMQDMLADVDLRGTTTAGLAEYTVSEVLKVGRIGYLVEFPQVSATPINAAAAAAMNLRPYASRYCAESIINWRVERINNVMQPTLVVLSETHEEREDEYSSNYVPQLRVLKLVEGVYVQEVWRKADNSDWVMVESVVPQMRGAPLDFIPFYAFGPMENTLCVQEPPILDLADLNLAHYRVTADYEHGTHFTGLPMLFLAGIRLEDNQKVFIGSQAAIVSDNPDAHGEFIEFSGQGLGALEGNLDRKEKQMAVLGARMLEQQKAGVESEGAMQLRSNGESSVLAAMANLVSMGMSKMLTFMNLWAFGSEEEVKVSLNTDYMPVGLTSAELAELVKSWQSGAISFDTLFANLQRGEIIAADVTIEDEREKIEAEAPSLAVEDGNSQRSAA
jgi:hypothetical protein